MVQTDSGGPSPAGALQAIAFGAVAITTRALQTVGLELTFVQWRVLVIVGATEDGLTVSEIAARIGSELSPTSRLVARMARRGLVTLVKEDVDRRVTRVTLSSEGRRVRHSVLERRLALLVAVLAAAGPISPEVVAGLQRIGDAFAQFT
jgi:DNA-binding MarR family transcriptional regulator